MANEEQAVFWTEKAGVVWLEREKELEDQSRRFGLAGIDVAAPKPGERVIDIGCGTGPTTLEIAGRIATDGHVTGLDISPLLLGRAREHAQEAGLMNVTFIEGDAQTYPLEPASADLVFSRFGVMFFEDPVAAFTNLRRALKPAGRLAFVCWQDVSSNVWMGLPTMASALVLGDFELPPQGSPGPFAFADADRVRKILEQAGYADIEVRDLKATMDIPVQEAEQRLIFLVRMGPLGDRFTEADEDTKRKTIDAVLEAAQPHRSDGAYKLPAAVWIVTARNA